MARTSGAVLLERSNARCRPGKEPFGVRRRTKSEPAVAQPAARWLGIILVDGFSEPEALVELGQNALPWSSEPTHRELERFFGAVTVRTGEALMSSAGPEASGTSVS